MDKPEKLNKPRLGMQHFNNNVLCAVDVETTGTDPEKDEIVQLAILPLDSDFNPSKVIQPVNFFIKPEHPFEYYASQGDLECGIKAIKIACDIGIDAYTAGNLIADVWFPRLITQKLKQIMPLAHNWIFDSAFLRKFFGNKTYELMFHFHYRDSMTVATFLNDVAGVTRQDYPFARMGLNNLINALGMERLKDHDALTDCLYTARVYQQLVRVYQSLWTGPIKNFNIPELGGPVFGNSSTETRTSES